MKNFKETVLWILLLVVMTPFAFLLMPLIALAWIWGGIQTMFTGFLGNNHA